MSSFSRLNPSKAKSTPVLAGLLGFLLSFTAGLAQGVVQFELVENPAKVTPGETFDATLRATIDPGWHLYSMHVPEGGPIPTTIQVVDDEFFASAGEPTEPTPIPWFDQNFGMETNYFADSVDFQVPVRVKPGAPPGSRMLAVDVRFMACDDSSCLPPQKKRVEAMLDILEGGGGLSEAGVTASPEGGVAGSVGSLAESETTPAAPGAQAAGGPEEAESIAVPSEGGLPAGTLPYIWFAMTMGALALLTPCVFPMIPITVSYFTKRNAKTRARSIFEAGLYSVGIIATFTFLGFLLTFLFGAGGINRLAASPLVNIAIAAIFIVFALSLFGVLELALPNSWLNAVNRESGRHKGVLGILLMALTFSLTSFTCTVPFVGTVMVAALQGDWIWSLMGMTAFAAVFSLPFFVLALFPSLLQSLPKSGNWMNSVKITMGFLELAAALKFISNVDLVYQWEILTRPIFITFWLAIGLVLVVYLLGWFRFPHETPSEAIGAFRVMSAIFFLAVTFYLFRGLFGFSLGELDAFLPPRDYGAVEASLAGAPFLAAFGHTEEDRWYDDYGEALSVARREGKPVFIDFTGYTCTNCRWMEANMFPLPRVSELMDQFVRVRLYTDGGEPVHEANQRFEQERFKTIALPFYALMTPDDEVIATFPGLTRNSNEFVEFLQKGTRYLQAGEDLSLSLPGR